MDTPEIPVPIHTDEHGTIRVGGTRVTLDVVLARYQQGRTLAEIKESFPTLKLADIYAVISYYLSHQAEVDEYLRQQDEEAVSVRQQLEAENPELFALEDKFRKLLAERAK